MDPTLITGKTLIDALSHAPMMHSTLVAAIGLVILVLLLCIGVIGRLVLLLWCYVIVFKNLFNILWGVARVVWELIGVPVVLIRHWKRGDAITRGKPGF
jgi:hypothetical protein